MKASILSQHGDQQTFQFGEIPKPEPKPNEVLVNLKNAALNHVDVWVRKGLPAYPVTLPHVMGADGSGVIEKLGSEVEGVSVGDRVLIFPALSCGACALCRTGRDNQCSTFEILGTRRAGTYAEYVSVPDNNIMAIPDSLNFEEAAAFPLAYLTAWHMLVGRAKLVKGENVLIVGAGGGVGVAALQISKMMGARAWAVTSHSEKSEKLKLLGAEGVCDTAQKKDFSDWIHQQTQGAGVDVVVEHVGPATWPESLKSLAAYGRLVTCGATTGPSITMELRSLFGRDLSILGARMGTKKEFQSLTSHVFSGEIKPVIDKIFPLAEAGQAHQHMDSGLHLGKILLSI